MNEKRVKNEEKVPRSFMIEVLDKLNNKTTEDGISVYELAKFLHRNTDDDDENFFSQAIQREKGCDKVYFLDYVEAWNDKYLDIIGEVRLPCKNTTNNSKQIHEHETFTSCCNMFQVIQKQKLSTILKVMKYSIQPVVFHEPLEDFLESYDNLDFLPLNNWTKYSQGKRHYLTDINLNPIVLSCNYAKREKM